MSTQAERAGRKALTLSAVAGTFLAAMLGLAADQAMAAGTARVQAGTLQITGDGASDKLALRLRGGAPTTLDVDFGADGTAEFSFDRGTFTAIRVQAGAGDDEVRIDQSGGAFTDEAITLDGGSGDDTLIGASGAETFIGGSGADSVDGNIGADTASLGGGDDRFQWDPGDGSDVVDGQGGDDRLEFNGSNAGEEIALSANGSLVRLTRNIAAITMDLDGIENVAVRTLGSVDTLTVNDLDGTDLKEANVDLSATGGGGDGSVDRVIANGTEDADDVEVGSDGATAVVSGLSAQVRVTGSEPALDTVTAATLGGEDSIAASAQATGDAAVTVDGGDGADTATYTGTSGADTIGVARNGAAVATFAPGAVLMNTSGVEDLVVRGLGGADTVAGQNGIGSLTHLTVDGGSDDDTVRGGDGADTLVGGSGADLVDGNIGADTAFLGSGNDRFQWDPGDGSDVVEGQGGNDALNFNGSNAGEEIALSANGSRVRLTRNIAAITMDFDGIESAVVRALGSVDTITVNDLAGTALDEANVDLSATGGGGDGSADRVIANGTEYDDDLEVGSDGAVAVVSGLSAELRVTGAEPTLDTVTAATLGGADSITASSQATGDAAVTVDGGDGADTATYTGTAAADTIGVARNGAAVAAFAPGAVLMNISAVEDLVVRGLGGADTVSGQNGIGSLTHLTVDGGSGDDSLRGGDGADTLLGGSGADLVDGNIGADTASLGGGDDRFQWDPGDGSDVVEGQGGDDALAFNGSNAGEEIALSANGSRVRLTRNIAAITMDFDGIESAVVRALGATDTITVDDLTGTDLRAADVDLSATGGGDGSADTVITNGTDKRDVVNVTRAGSQVLTTGLRVRTTIVGSEAANDTLRVNTLGGNDDVTVAPDVSDLIATVVDLGTGE